MTQRMEFWDGSSGRAVRHAEGTPVMAVGVSAWATHRCSPPWSWRVKGLLCGVPHLLFATLPLKFNPGSRFSARCLGVLPILALQCFSWGNIHVCPASLTSGRHRGVKPPNPETPTQVRVEKGLTTLQARAAFFDPPPLELMTPEVLVHGKDFLTHPPTQFNLIFENGSPKTVPWLLPCASAGLSGTASLD